MALKEKEMEEKLKKKNEEMLKLVEAELDRAKKERRVGNIMDSDISSEDSLDESLAEIDGYSSPMRRS